MRNLVIKNFEKNFETFFICVSYIIQFNQANTVDMGLMDSY